jgi:hypothetical protein
MVGVHGIDMREVEITSIDLDSRESIPFSEGDTVSLQDKPAVGAFLRANGESLVGKLHSDDTTFVFQSGIRTGEIKVE